MIVTVKLLAELRKVFGTRELQLVFDSNKITIAEAIYQLLSMEEGGQRAAGMILSGTDPAVETSGKITINPALILLINDADFRLSGGMSAMLHDGDTITLVPTVHGG